MKPIATSGKRREPFPQGLMVFDGDHVAFLVFDELHGPTRRLKQVSNGPPVLDGDPNILFAVHPKQPLGFELVQTQTKFHWTNEAGGHAHDALDAVGDGQLK